MKRLEELLINEATDIETVEDLITALKKVDSKSNVKISVRGKETRSIKQNGNL